MGVCADYTHKLTEEEELETLELTAKNKWLLEKGLLEEQNYKDKIPAGFDAVYKSAEEKYKMYSREFGNDVRKAYDLLREGNIPPLPARDITMGRYIKFDRTEKHILRHLPDECKNTKMQELQKKSEVTKEAKRIVAKENEKTKAEKQREKEIKIRLSEIKEEEEIDVEVKPGIFMRMVLMCVKANEPFKLKINVVSKTLVDVFSSEEGEPEPAAPRPR